MKQGERRVVITGLGAVTPLGTGNDVFWNNLAAGKSGVAPLKAFGTDGLPTPFAAEVRDFDTGKFITPRKRMKLMAADITLAMGSAALAVEDAALKTEQFDESKFGVNYGAGLIAAELSEMQEAVRHCANGNQRVDLKDWGKTMHEHIYPLWMLKYLPNMPASHISIAYQAKGPNNSITSGEASATLAIGEAYRVIQRGTADVFIAGGTDSKIHPLSIVRLGLLGRLCTKATDPERLMRPFDRDRGGIVPGEASAAVILEEASLAKRRGAKIRGEVLGFASACDPLDPATSIEKVIRRALQDAGLKPSDLGHISAVGTSGVQEDRDEAIGLARALGADAARVPIVAYKSLVGPTAAAAGAVELVASLLAIDNEMLLPVKNFENPDPDFPKLDIVQSPRKCPDRPFLSLGRSYSGQCAAIVVGPFAN